MNIRNKETKAILDMALNAVSETEARPIKVTSSYAVPRMRIGSANTLRTNPDYPLAHEIRDPGWGTGMIQGNGALFGGNTLASGPSTKAASVQTQYTDASGRPRDALGRTIDKDGTPGSVPELGMNDPNSSMGASIGRWMRGFIEPGDSWKQKATGAVAAAFDNGVIPGALAAGVPAWLLGKGYEALSGREGVADKLALGGLAVGGGLGYMRKSSSDARAVCLESLGRDMTLTSADKASLVAGISRAPDSLLHEIAEHLPTIGGAAVGALISRYLFRAGLTGTVIGTLAGAAMGFQQEGRITSDHPYGAGRNWEGKSYLY